jgi:hypothetical protein
MEWTASWVDSVCQYGVPARADPQTPLPPRVTVPQVDVLDNDLARCLARYDIGDTVKMHARGHGLEAQFANASKLDHAGRVTLRELLKKAVAEDHQKILGGCLVGIVFEIS